MQINTNTGAEQCHFETLELHSYRRKIQDLKIRQNVKGVHHCPLYNHLLRKRSNLAYLGCNFVSKEGPYSQSGSQKPSICKRFFGCV